MTFPSSRLRSLNLFLAAFLGASAAHAAEHSVKFWKSMEQQNLTPPGGVTPGKLVLAARMARDPGSHVSLALRDALKAALTETDR